MSESIKTLTDQLCDLTKRWNEFEDIPRSQQLEATKIGRLLNEIGGMHAMRKAYYEAKGQNRATSVVQAYFHGIGDWQW